MVKKLDLTKALNWYLNYGKVIGTILRNLYRITLGIDFRTYMESLDGSLDGSNDGNIEGLLIGDSMGSTDGKVIGSNEGINWDYIVVKGLVIYLEM